MDATVLTIVPCRKGSKRLAGKNLRSVGGIPLIDRTLRCAKRANLNGPIIVSTDDEDIAGRAAAFGLAPPFQRPESLATDDASSLDVALHALDWVAARDGGDPDYVLLLQVTSPFRQPDDIHQAVALLSGNPAADAVVGVQPLHVGPRHVLHQSDSGLLRTACRADAGVPVLVPNGAIYLVRTTALRNQRSFYPDATMGLVMPASHSIDIDTADDLILADALARILDEAPAETAP
jgi:CMP-N,N'-diacetyllegionaminic acid synthase